MAQFTLVNHEIGKISRSGVLDIGLKCPHSCEFCYYSFLDRSEEQFKGIREAPFRSLEECKASLDYFVTQGFERIDITGGEPLMHPDITQIVHYAEKEKNLRVRIITLGQLFNRKDAWTGKRLFDALLDDCETTDFLFSLHATDEKLFHDITKGRLSSLESAMDELDRRGFGYCTNTVVYANNFRHIPELAKYIISRKHRVNIANFITMNAYYSWATGKAFGVQSSYTDTSSAIRTATDILENAGIGVNIRFGPYCVFEGIEKNFVGCVGVLFDPYEWRNSTANPFDIMARNEKEAYKFNRMRLAAHNKVFPSKCGSCAIKDICDGVDKNYLLTYGDGELRPYDGARINDVVHFRRQNPRVFALKQKIDSDGLVLKPRFSPDAISVKQQGLMEKVNVLSVAIRKFYTSRFLRKTYLSEIPMKNLSNTKAEWTDAAKLTGESSKMIAMAPGSIVQFTALIPKGKAVFISKAGAANAVDEKIILELSLEEPGKPGSLLGRWQVGRVGRWVGMKISLAPWAGHKVSLRLSCTSDNKSSMSQIYLLEPVIATKKPIEEMALFIFKYVKQNGLLFSYRRLLAYFYQSARGIRPD